jgi:hypothetical protein
MPSEAATAIAYIGAFAGLVAGGVALFNAHKAVRWKRAELASAYLKDLQSNQELVFACRALDWNGGYLVVPEQLRPLLPEEAKSILHDPSALRKAMSKDLTVRDMEGDPRLQLYRTALDSLLSWLSLVDNALERNLFSASDIRDVGYLVRQVAQRQWLLDFIKMFGYEPAMLRLQNAFR